MPLNISQSSLLLLLLQPICGGFCRLGPVPSRNLLEFWDGIFSKFDAVPDTQPTVL